MEADQNFSLETVVKGVSYCMHYGRSRGYGGEI